MKKFYIILFIVTTLGMTSLLSALAQTPSFFDLVNLKNQNLADITAYENIKIIDAWNFLEQQSLPLTPIIIGIIDSGIDIKHPEFSDVNFGNTPASAKVDIDVPIGHGTQVAGIIGANNISSVSSENYIPPQMNGIVSGVKNLNYILEARITNTMFDTLIDVFKLSFSGVKIINYSGGASLPDTTLGRITAQAVNSIFKGQFSILNNILFVISGGFGKDVELNVPGGLGNNLSNVITVGATKLDDSRLLDSDFGNAVNISAPGVNVYAPKPFIKPLDLDDYETTFGGASAAAPMVTGVAAILKSIKPELTPAEIKNILISTADPIITDKPIGPRLNALKAVQELVQPPFVRSIHWYQDPRPGKDQYLLEMFYDEYPFIPDKFNKGDTWKNIVFSLNIPPTEQRELTTQGNWQPDDLTNILRIAYDNCVSFRTPRHSLVLPDIASRCSFNGLNPVGLDFKRLEDPHILISLAQKPSAITFTPNDFITASYYSFLRSGGSTQDFGLVLADPTKINFQDIPPSHQAPNPPANINFQLNETLSHLAIIWDQAQDSDTVDADLTYEIQIIREPVNPKFDEGKWEKVKWPPDLDDEEARRLLESLEHNPHTKIFTIVSADPNTSHVVGIRAIDDFGNTSDPAVASFETADIPLPFAKNFKWGHLTSTSTVELSFEFDNYPFIPSGGFPWDAMIFYFNQKPPFIRFFNLGASDQTIIGDNQLLKLRYTLCASRNDAPALFLVQSSGFECFRRNSLPLTAPEITLPAGGNPGIITIDVSGPSSLTDSDFVTIEFLHTLPSGLPRGTFFTVGRSTTKQFFQE